MPGQSAQGRVPLKVPAKPLVSNGTTSGTVDGADSAAAGAGCSATASVVAGSAGATGSVGAGGLQPTSAVETSRASINNVRFIETLLGVKGGRRGMPTATPR